MEAGGLAPSCMVLRSARVASLSPEGEDRVTRSGSRQWTADELANTKARGGRGPSTEQRTGGDALTARPRAPGEREARARRWPC